MATWLHGWIFKRSKTYTSEALRPTESTHQVQRDRGVDERGEGTEIDTQGWGGGKGKATFRKNERSRVI